jgi:hypothetical protein
MKAGTLARSMYLDTAQGTATRAQQAAARLSCRNPNLMIIVLIVEDYAAIGSGDVPPVVKTRYFLWLHLATGLVVTRSSALPDLVSRAVNEHKERHQ